MSLRSYLMWRRTFVKAPSCWNSCIHWAIIFARNLSRDETHIRRNLIEHMRLSGDYSDRNLSKHWFSLAKFMANFVHRIIACYFQLSHMYAAGSSGNTIFVFVFNSPRPFSLLLSCYHMCCICRNLYDVIIHDINSPDCCVSDIRSNHLTPG